jgi:hypothetical protein
MFLIAANQIHSKIQRQRILGRRKYSKNPPDSPKAEDMYQAINESQVSEFINRYSVVEESRSESLSIPEYVDVDNPSLIEKKYDYAEEYDSCKILRITTESKLEDGETDKKSGTITPSACATGTLYLEPVVQQNTYLELIDETLNKPTDLHMRDDAYLDVVNI